MEQPLQSAEPTVEPIRKKRRKRRRRCKRHPKDGPHSPNCRGQKNEPCSINNHNLNMVKILPTMKPILDYLCVAGEIFTREKIMGHLTDYIKRKSLFDPEDPRKVYCGNDQLGVIFGCSEFSTTNACELLLCNLQPLTSALTIKQESHSSEPNDCGLLSCNLSTSHVNNCHFISTTDTCSCSESDQQSMNEALSSSHMMPSTSNNICQARAGSKRTHNASSDTSHPVRQSSESFYNVGVTISGYSSSLPSDDSEQQRPFKEFKRHYKHVCENVTDVVSDTSDDLFFLNETEEESVLVETNQDRFVEEYEPLTYSEEEQVIASYRNIVNDNEGNSFNTAAMDEGDDGGDELDNSESDSEIEEDDKWECESCAERNHPMTRNCSKCWALRKNWCTPSLNRTMSDPVSLQNNTPQTDQASVSDCATTSHDIEQVGDDSYGGFNCTVCKKEPRNGCIIHGHTGHQVCCVGCARRLKEQRKPCPVCHRIIEKVIKNFT